MREELQGPGQHLVLGVVTKIRSGFGPKNAATFVAPKATRTPGSSPAPVIVIAAPPAIDPIDGVTEKIVGAGFRPGLLSSGWEGAVGPRPHAATPQTVRRFTANNRPQRTARVLLIILAPPA